MVDENGMQRAKGTRMYSDQSNHDGEDKQEIVREADQKTAEDVQVEAEHAKA